MPCGTGLCVSHVWTDGLLLFEKAIPSGYTDCVEHYEDGFMDYTDYCKYFYTQEADAVLRP